MIELINIAKTYYLEERGNFIPRVALKCVNVKFESGKIHSILGENGAGKSTLVHILSGRIKPSGGVIKIDGKICSFSSFSDALKKGVAIIFQSLPQVSVASVLENIMLLQRGFINSELCSKIKLSLQEWGVENIDFNERLNSLSKEECFLLELVNYLSLKPNVLILDESSSFMPYNKRDGFFKKLKEKAFEQNIAIVLITHDIDEAIKVSDAITMIKDGKNLETLDMLKLKNKKINEEIKAQLEKSMYGRLVQNKKIIKNEESKNIGIEIRCEEMDNLFIEARECEITGVVSSSKILEEIFCGMLSSSYRKNYRGSIKFKDGSFLSFKDITASLLLKNKIGFIPSDRYYRASNPQVSIKEVLSCYHIKAKIIDEKEREGFVSSILKEEGIEASISSFCNNLSGGQLQRIILARCLKEKPKIIILVEPMRGLDVASIEAMKNKLRKLKKEGKTILIITQEENIYSDILDRVIMKRISNY